jgi:type II secretory pathway pseudopilin PulG
MSLLKIAVANLSIYKNQKNLSKIHGLSMVEILIVIAIIAILIILALSVLPRQLEKARDAQRKSDLSEIKVAFENYYSDNDCYPPPEILENCGGTQLSPYLNQIPCDPADKSYYLYAPEGKACPGYYRVFSRLERKSDPVIPSLSCQGPGGCGAWQYFQAKLGLAANDYNYGVSEGVPVYMGEGGTLDSGYCCSNILNDDDCKFWEKEDPEGQCTVGPYASYDHCIASTICVEPLQ